MPLSLTRAPLPATLVSFGSFSSADFKVTTLITSQAPHQSPELMKEAIMPLSLIRASCSSAAVVFSGSLGSADSGMPMVIASCEPSDPQLPHCYLHETFCNSNTRHHGLSMSWQVLVRWKLSSKATPRSFPCMHGASCPAQLWPVGHLPCKHYAHCSAMTC